MPQFYTLLTDSGQAKIANAVALGAQIEITQMAVGDGGGNPVTPDSRATALVNEVRRAPINAVQTDDDNPTWIVIEQVLPPDVGGWTIREVGVFDAAGDLIATGNLPETYKPVLAEGSSRTQTIRVVMEVSDTAAVTLKVDPSVVLATREYVDQQRQAHEQSRNHPAATETAQGMLEIANDAEALAGTDDARAMTPEKVHAAFGKFGLGNHGDPDFIANIDDLEISTGFYTASTLETQGTKPFEFDGGFQIIVNAYRTNYNQYTVQIAITNTDSGNRMFLRAGSHTLPGTGFTEWKEILTSEEKATKSEAEDGTDNDSIMTALRVRESFSQFGLGDGNFKETIDPDTLIKQGFYFVNGDSTGLPLAVDGSLTVTGHSDRPGQIFMPAKEGRIFSRSRYNDGGNYHWTAWREITVEGNVASAAEAQSLSGLEKLLTPGRLDDSFKGGNQDLSGDSGYQILPGGLIIQWGRRLQQVNENPITVNFPIAFTKKLIAVLPYDLSGAATVYNFAWHPEESGLSYADIWCNQNNTAQSFAYICIGE